MILMMIMMVMMTMMVIIKATCKSSRTEQNIQYSLFLWMISLAKHHLASCVKVSLKSFKKLLKQ